MQNPTGGFGGGQGQYSHCAASYAAILSIAMVGGDAAYNIVDRKALWMWLGQLKQSNGGFEVCEEGEEDVRGAYCALVMISLLNLPVQLPSEAPARKAGLSTFLDGVGGYFTRCQTFEGGISGAPGNEAHGAYAFCALAGLSLIGDPRQTFYDYLDVSNLMEWLSARQYAPEGGFAGRTNKLVDGCYSHWVGGCWPLLHEAIGVAGGISDLNSAHSIGSLFSKEALGRYILCCCQAESGGLRDKPST